MNAKITRTTRNPKSSRSPWLAAGAALLALGFSVSATLAAPSDLFEQQAVVYPTPTPKPQVGTRNPPPANPCPGRILSPNCNQSGDQAPATATPTLKPRYPTVTPVPDMPDPTATPTPRPRKPTLTPTPEPEEPTATPTPRPKPPTKTPTPEPEPEPTVTPVPPTVTPVPPTATPIPPTNTPRPTRTPVPPTATSVPTVELPVVPEPTPVPTRVPPTSTPLPEPTATPTPEPPNIAGVVDDADRTATPVATDEPTPEPTVEVAKATPVPPTPTVAVAESTATPESIVAAAPGDPTQTPPPPATPAPSDSQPSEPVEVASSNQPDPAPYVLFGTLLFALAAVAGQMLRGGSLMVRPLTHAGDALRRGASQPISGFGSSTPEPTTFSDASSSVRGEGQTQADVRSQTSTDSHTLTDFVDPDHVAQTLTGKSGGSLSSGGLGGQDGGFSKLADGAGHGNSFAQSNGAGVQGDGFGGGNGFGQTAPDGSGNLGSSQADLKVSGQQANGPSDYSPRPTTAADAAPKPAAGGNLGGGAGETLARGLSPTGSDLASAPGAGGSGGGLGGNGGGDALARSIGGPQDVLASAPNGAPADALMHVGTGGGPGLGGNAGGMGDALARGVPSELGGQATAAVGHTMVAQGGELLAVGASWLSAGALGRAGDGYEDAGQTLSDPRDSATLGATGVQALDSATVTCRSCGRQLPYGHRYCGYCGESLDKTLM